MAVQLFICVLDRVLKESDLMVMMWKSEDTSYLDIK